MAGRHRKDSWEQCRNHSNDKRLDERVNVVIDELIANNVSIEEFRKVFGRNQKGGVLDGHLGFPTEGEVVPIKKKIAFELHSYFNINLEKLLIEKHEEDEYFKGHDFKKDKKTKKVIKVPRKKETYFLHRDWDKFRRFKNKEKAPAIKIVPVSTESKDNNTDLNFAYERLSEKIRNAKSSIVVWENTFKGNNNDPGKQGAYKIAQSLVFNEIYQLLGKNQEEGGEFNYTRIFNLSSDNTLPYKGKFYKLVDEISCECLEHIINCSNEFSQYCEFIVLEDVSRYRNHCIIDSSIMLTEDYIKLYEDTIPRVIHLDEMGNIEDFKVFINSIERDMDRGRKAKINVKKLLTALLELRDYYENLKIGEFFITESLYLVRQELMSRKTDSALLAALNGSLKEKIENDYYYKQAKIQKKMVRLNACFKSPDFQVFGDIVEKREFYQAVISNRLKAINRKISVFKKNPLFS